VLASTDLAVVSQKRGLSQESIPSKLFTIMASGRPVLGLVEQGGEVDKLVKTAQAGRCFPPGNVKAVVEFILEMEHHPELKNVYGKNARAYAVEHFDRQEAAVQFHQVLVQRIAGQSTHA
jgi:colanic acid biosynthesis glycosyl transferase WcaI